MRVRKIAESGNGNDGGWELESADDRTVERRVRVAAPAKSLYTTRLTKRMTAIDPRILAIARGDAEPEAPPAPAAVTLVRPGRVDGVEDDPFGGLIPVVDDETTEVEESWLEESPPSTPSKAPESRAVAREGTLDLDLDLDFDFAVEEGWSDEGVEPEPFSLPGLRRSG
jgi:hypothetical protein